jgi:hypothetical protein
MWQRINLQGFDHISLLCKYLGYVERTKHDCSAYSGLDILDILGHLSRENMLQEDAGVFSRMM